MIIIENVKFSYPGSNFIFSINKLDIADGEKVAVTAPSGYGKTTFLNLISCILTPKEGNIIIEDEIVNNFTSQVCCIRE